jgi:hypothetical protein
MSKALAVLFPVYKREHLAQISARCLARIGKELEPDGITMRVLIVGNEGWAHDMAEAYGWEYLNQSNQILGQKFDNGARWIVDNWGGTCSHFMEWGADNITSRAFSELLRARILGPQVHQITTNAFYMINEKTGEVRLFDRGAGSNIGRLTSMKVAQVVRNTAGGNLYDHQLKRGLDRSFRLKVQAVTGRRCKLHDIATPYLIDVKGPGSLNSWNTFASKPERFPLTELEGEFPEFEDLKAATWQPQASSDPTPSTSTSTPCKAPTPSTTPLQTTPGKSSPAQPAGRSRASSKRSTRQAKTTTGRGKSSSRQSAGASKRKGSSNTTT